MSKLLINEPPLQVLPTLAKTIGLNKAIVLQQIHYWLGLPKIGKVDDIGIKWVRNSIPEWQQGNFPFWSEKTVKRILDNLIDEGLVLWTDRLNKFKQDRTRWYTIDYDALDQRDKLSPPKRTSCHPPRGQVVTPQEDKLSPTLPETTTETTTETLENPQPPKTQHTDTEREALNKLGKVIAHSGLNNPTTTDELRAITLTGFEIAKMARTDILAIDTGELSALAGLTIRLSAKGNITAKLKAFETWWYANDWRGKQSQSPTVKQMGSTWGQFEADKVSPANGATSGPVLTEAKKARLVELTAQFSQPK
ncbi:hypothetical protein LCGC14_0891050 [marine sediment metagenome]|uniref:Uncharacterized protein n=1 Tax=marine sediment metagenome TaxID=412755 RepID=A0A0F9S687_9ZZZZ